MTTDTLTMPILLQSPCPLPPAKGPRRDAGPWRSVPVSYLPGVVAIALTIAIGTPAHAGEPPPCVSGGVCCTTLYMNQGRAENACGPLERFQRYARLICLQWKAIETPTLEQTAEGWGRCHMAKAAAENVAAAQHVSDLDHQRAAEAQRQLKLEFGR